MTTQLSQTGHRYQLIARGECGPLTEWMSGDAAIEPGNDFTNLTVSARDDSELYGLLGRIQDLGLHLITLNEIGGTETVPHLPLRASLAHPGASPIDGRGTPYPPVGSRGLPPAAPAGRTRNAQAARCRQAADRVGRVTDDHLGVNEWQEGQ